MAEWKADRTCDSRPVARILRDQMIEDMSSNNGVNSIRGAVNLLSNSDELVPKIAGTLPPILVRVVTPRGHRGSEAMVPQRQNFGMFDQSYNETKVEPTLAVKGPTRNSSQ